LKAIIQMSIEDAVRVNELAAGNSTRELLSVDDEVSSEPTLALVNAWRLRRSVESVVDAEAADVEEVATIVRSSDDDVVPSAPSVVYVVRYLSVWKPELLLPIPVVLAVSFPVLVYGVRRRFGCSRIVVEVNVAEESKVLR
jgi:hypothetical protein